jgi:hypothetical protein
MPRSGQQRLDVGREICGERPHELGGTAREPGDTLADTVRDLG